METQKINNNNIKTLGCCSPNFVDFLAGSHVSKKLINKSNFIDKQTANKINNLNKFNSETAEAHKLAISNLLKITSELARA